MGTVMIKTPFLMEFFCPWNFRLFIFQEKPEVNSDGTDGLSS